MDINAKIFTEISEKENDIYSFFKEVGIATMKDYKRDKEVHLFNKMCMVNIENADLLTAYMGSDNYFSYLRMALNEIYKFLNESQIKGILNAYIVDSKTFIIVGKPQVNKDTYLNIIESLYARFRHINLESTNIPLLARFITTLNPDNMLETAIKEMNSLENIHKEFILCKDSKTEPFELTHELKMINVIEWAIKNNGVIPYYQGIYDTKTKKIDKYEALMRIIDKYSNVYSPDHFIDIAKKYHMYSKLSEMMISRVLKETENTNMVVSINLSAYDINSPDFRRSFFDLLRQRRSKSLIVIEILEDEIFKNTEVLQQFILDVGRYGVKIAIDDFGSGYSNLLGIAQISPHYIKIDGEIVKGMNDTEKNKEIIESIVYLSKKINAFTVAEHVESSTLINSLEQLGIDLLQGYCFSRPVPIKEILLGDPSIL